MKTIIKSLVLFALSLPLVSFALEDKNSQSTLLISNSFLQSNLISNTPLKPKSTPSPIPKIENVPVVKTTQTKSLETPTSFKVNLKYGSKGEDVEQLQDFLQDQGFYKGKITGKYLLSTVSAVKAFQKAKKLKISGYWDKATRTKANFILKDILKASREAERAER